MQRTVGARVDRGSILVLRRSSNSGVYGASWSPLTPRWRTVGTMTRLSSGIAALGLAAGLVLAPAVAANATTTYSSCASVHRHYSGGIAKTGVRYNTIRHSNGTVTRVLLKGHVLHSTTSYNANKRLDRDHDGVACEKS